MKDEEKTKKQLLSLHGLVCQGCYHTFPASWSLEVDHIRPKAEGGGEELDNLTLLCAACNRLKRDTYTLTGLRRLNRKKGRLAEQGREKPQPPAASEEKAHEHASPLEQPLTPRPARGAVSSAIEWSMHERGLSTTWEQLHEDLLYNHHFWSGKIPASLLMFKELVESYWPDEDQPRLPSHMCGGRVIILNTNVWESELAFRDIGNTRNSRHLC